MNLYEEYRRSLTNTSETLELGRSIKSIGEKYLSGDSYVTGQISRIISSTEDVELLQARAKGSSYTITLKELDDERDDIKTGLDSDIEGKIKLKRYDMIKGDAADAVNEMFITTPINIRAGYAVESNQINTRIRLVNTPGGRALFETMGTLPVWDRFIEVQGEFEKVSSEKDALESVKLRGTVREQVAAIQDRINYILYYLTSQAQDLPHDYEAPAKEIFEAVQRIMTIAQARQTKKMNDLLS